jgi:hypothetical protein
MLRPARAEPALQQALADRAGRRHGFRVGDRAPVAVGPFGDHGVIRGRPGVLAPAGSDGPRTSWITDPDGYRIELVQWPAGGQYCEGRG